MIYVSIAAILMIFEFLKSLSYKTEQLLIIEAIMNINLFLQRRLIQLNIMDNLILKANNNNIKYYCNYHGTKYF